MGSYTNLITRYSVRNFKDTPIPKNIIEKIIYAGHRAATARNAQPWKFVVVTNQEKRIAIKHLCPKNGPFIDIAPVCICVFCEKTTYYLEDGSAASQNILNAANALGLGSVWVAGDKKDYAEEIKHLLNMPTNYTLISLIVIGYPENEISPTPRKALEEVIIWEDFNFLKKKEDTLTKKIFKKIIKKIAAPKSKEKIDYSKGIKKASLQ